MPSSLYIAGLFVKQNCGVDYILGTSVSAERFLELAQVVTVVETSHLPQSVTFLTRFVRSVLFRGLNL